MMDIISTTLIIITIIILINSILIDYIDKKTYYRHKLSYDKSKLIWLLIFFSFILVFYQQKLKNYRKNKYFTDRLRYIEYERIFFKDFKDMWLSIYGNEYQECLNYFRYEKIKKLQKLSKKSNLLKKIKL